MQDNGFVRDQASKALINNRAEEYRRFVAEKAKNRRINTLEQTVEELMRRIEALETRLANGNT